MATVSGNYTAIVQVKVSDSELQKQLKTVGNKTTIDIKVNADTTEIDNLKSSINNTSKEISSYSSSASKASQANNTIATSADKASKSTNQLQGYIERTKKVFDFGLSTASLGLLYGALNEAKEAVFDFDAALTEFNKVSDLSGESLDAYTQKLADMGEEVGRSRTEMLESATMFKKTGSTEEESAELAKVAEMYRNIADAQVSSADAASFLVSQMKAYNITAEDSVEIIDKVNEVANNFSVGTNDLQLALQTSSSTLGTLGNDLSETISLLTAGTEIIVNQPQRVGRGLRSIGLELNSLAQETDTLTDSTGKVSVAFKDEEGNLKSTYQILSDLYPQWQQLNEEQKANLANQIAGKTQADTFTAVMNNFSSAIEAFNTAQNAEGSAMKENERAMESLAV